MHETRLLQEITTQLAERDWAVQEGFLEHLHVRRLRAEADSLRTAGRFRAGGIGQGAEQRIDIRGDQLLWLEPDLAPLAWQLLRSELETLRLAVNAATFLGLHEFEGHYAAYPPGAFYARHLDRFREDNQRVVSVVLYLNDAWPAADGGELKLYPEGARETVAVAPRGGTLVCFLSERVPHEVLPARRLRLSLAGWFRRRA